MNKVPYLKRLSTKISMSFILSSVLIIFILSMFLYSQSYKMVIKSASEKSFKISETVAENIDMNGFENLKSKEDEQSYTYKRINKEFNYIRKITGARYIYTIRKDNKGKYEYVVDGLDIKEEDISHIGDESEEYEGYEDVYKGKKYANNKIEIWNDDIIISSYYPLKNKMGKIIGFIGVDYDVKTEYLRLKEIKNTIIILAISLSIISIIYGAYFARKITKPIVSVSRIANKVSNYDLNVEKIENISNDEIGILSNTFNIMIDNLKDMIKGIKNIAEIIDKDSMNMNASMQQALASIENINENIGEIAGGSEKTSNDIGELNDIILNSNEFSNNVVENTKKAIDVSIDMKSSACTGNTYVESIISKINNIGDDIEETEFVINELNDKTKNINEIIKIINKISKKTNMLALNANIEASRAGESGRGFAVVANEVKNLSDQTNIYADEINATIISVLESTERIIESMNNVKISVKENEDTGKITKKVFDELVGKINNTDTLINGISNLVKKQLVNSEDILDKSETVSEISQETTASCQSTMAISEKIKEDIYNIAQSTNNLMSICNELNNVVDKFKI